MPRLLTASPRRLPQAAVCVLLLAMVSCAPLPPTAAVAVPPIPAGQARVWFYRDGGPSDTQQMTFLRMNGAIVAISQPSSALYRDVAPGQYHVAADNYLGDFNSTREVYLYPGQQMYFKIVSLKNWIVSGNRFDNDFSRPTFYVWDIPAEIAQGEVGRSQFYGGS